MSQLGGWLTGGLLRRTTFTISFLAKYSSVFVGAGGCLEDSTGMRRPICRRRTKICLQDARPVVH